MIYQTYLFLRSAERNILAPRVFEADRPVVTVVSEQRGGGREERVGGRGKGGLRTIQVVGSPV